MITCSLVVEVVLGRLSVSFFMTVVIEKSYKSMEYLQKKVLFLFSSNKYARHDLLLLLGST